jgi:hypothetical protein
VAPGVVRGGVRAFGGSDFRAATGSVSHGAPSACRRGSPEWHPPVAAATSSRRPEGAATAPAERGRGTRRARSDSVAVWIRGLRRGPAATVYAGIYAAGWPVRDLPPAGGLHPVGVPLLPAEQAREGRPWRWRAAVPACLPCCAERCRQVRREDIGSPLKARSMHPRTESDPAPDPERAATGAWTHTPESAVWVRHTIQAARSKHRNAADGFGSSLSVLVKYTMPNLKSLKKFPCRDAADRYSLALR